MKLLSLLFALVGVGMSVRGDVDLDASRFTNLQSVSAVNPVLWTALQNLQMMWLRSNARKRTKIHQKASLQEAFPESAEFPCDISLGVSKVVPDSVHRLRPGDIRVVGALGDSLTSASGALSTELGHMFVENRGLSWNIGGEWTWRNSTTLPNILKMFNPDLIGYSLNDSFAYTPGVGFNMAEIGANSGDLLGLAKVLVKRILADPRVNFTTDWKLLTIAMGANDICSYICALPKPSKLPKLHRRNLLETLRYLRAELPRTLVNLVSIPKVHNILDFPKKDGACKMLEGTICSCFHTLLFNATNETRALFEEIEEKFHRVEAEVSLLQEFRGLKEFAVVHQTFTEELTFDTDGQGPDRALLAYDCFHMSQKAHAYAGVSYWNNLLEPVGRKTRTWMAPSKRFLCPSEASPFIFTSDNS